MQSHELLREVFQDGNVKDIAAQMDLSIPMVYKWAQPATETGSGATNPLDRMEALVRSTQDKRVVQWVCEKAGGFFITNPKGINPCPQAVMPATNQIVQEFADMLAVIASAAVDNAISKKEAQNIRGRWEELKTVTGGFVRCCEEGNFDRIKTATLA